MPLGDGLLVDPDPRDHRGGHAFPLTSYGRLCGLAGDVALYLACAERAAALAEGSDDAALAFEMRAVLAHAQLAVGRLDPARAMAEQALAELARDVDLREALGRSTAPAFCRIYWALTSAYLGKAADAQADLEALLADERESGLEACTGRTASCARCCGCGAISPARSLTAAALSSWRRSAAARSPGSRPPRFSAPPSSRPATSPPPRGRSRPPSGSRARGAPRVVRAAHPGDARGREASRRRPLRSPRVRRAGTGLAAQRLRRRAGAGPPACLGARPDRTALESALVSVETLAAELGADPYRRMAELERARLARTVSVTPPHAASSRPRLRSGPAALADRLPDAAEVLVDVVDKPLDRYRWYAKRDPVLPTFCPGPPRELAPDPPFGCSSRLDVRSHEPTDSKGGGVTCAAGGPSPLASKAVPAP